ncbi:hypothetical protein TNCV_1289161 [Trichonephila clavipes]|nr:hypothetical protein TNCV_1289161 [Trichonephila clavipes]
MSHTCFTEFKSEENAGQFIRVTSSYCRHSLTMFVWSVLEPRIIPPPTEQSCSTRTLSVNGTWSSPYESPVGIRQQAKHELVGKHHRSPLLRCPQNMPSTPG